MPENNADRLSKWPALESGDALTITGIDWKVSVADVILSSAGWIAVTPGPECSCKVKGWTPGGRGIYLRTPSLLSQAVNLRGKSVRGSVAYNPSKFY